MSVPAGWYADDSMPGFDRYWDGNWWTAQTRESARLSEHIPKPPDAPRSEEIQVVIVPPVTPLLAMSRSELDQQISDFVDREKTIPALVNLYEVESETLRMANEILKGHEVSAGRAVIRPQIQSLVAWQKERKLTAIADLGVAMETDFNDLVRELGGSLFLPVPMELAWENYVAPIKLIVDQIQGDVTPRLQAVAEIENMYLFV